MRVLIWFASLLLLFGPTVPGQQSVLMVVVNRANTIETITTAQLRKLLLGQEQRWPNKQTVIVVQRDAESSEFRHVLRGVLHMTPFEYKRYILGREFQGGDSPRIKNLNSSEGALKFVFNVPGAFAVLDETAGQGLSDEVKVIRVDGKLPEDPGYSLR